MTDFYAYDAGLPCKNPNCKSHGHPHPNCKCYEGSGVEGGYAKGGSVCVQGLPHQPGCEYYAQGGSVAPMPAQAPDDIPNTVGMAALHHGLLGLMTNVGHSKLSEPDNHHHKIYDLRNEPDPEKHHEMVHGHPLSGGAAKTMLKPIMERMAGPLQTQEVHPEAARAGIQYLASSIKGENQLKDQMSNFLGMHKNATMQPDKEAREHLKQHLQSIDEKPEQMLAVGGTLGHYLPEHAAGLAYTSAKAVQYLRGLKPQPMQLAPLDTIQEVDKGEMATYDRQLDIAQNPSLLIQNLKDGTVQPLDLTTVQTIYPGLYKGIVKHATEALIDPKNKDAEIPYKQKMSLSMLLGAPLDFTQSGTAGMAIIGANTSIPSPSQAQPPKGKPKGSSKPKSVSSTEYKAIEKSDQLSETPLEARLIDKTSH